jgi:hypothetical protein
VTPIDPKPSWIQAVDATGSLGSDGSRLGLGGS